METMVTARIDVSRPVGRNLVKDLESKKYVSLHFETPEIAGVWHDFSDVFQRGLEKMSEHYGVDMRELMMKEHPKTYYDAIQI